MFFERLSEQLARVIEDLRNRLIDSAEACRRLGAVAQQILGLDAFAAEHGLSPLAFAVYELLDGRLEEPGGVSSAGSEAGAGGGGGSGSAGSGRGSGESGEGEAGDRVRIDEEAKRVALEIESVVERHRAVVDWQSNLEVQRQMRRDVKRGLRPAGAHTEEQLDELANRVVELARRRSGR